MHVPVNAAGTTVDAVGLLDPALGDVGLERLTRTPHTATGRAPPARPATGAYRPRSSTYALYAATWARRATRSTGRSASPRAAISEALTAPPGPFS
ncbi:hypothetical protein QFZ58_005629 [Streptomyces sp. B1I3]|nr:hypothetical protein [Streptomyces sp. B1I3]